MYELAEANKMARNNPPKTNNDDLNLTASDARLSREWNLIEFHRRALGLTQFTKIALKSI